MVFWQSPASLQWYAYNGKFGGDGNGFVGCRCAALWVRLRVRQISSSELTDLVRVQCWHMEGTGNEHCHPSMGWESCFVQPAVTQVICENRVNNASVNDDRTGACEIFTKFCALGKVTHKLMLHGCSASRSSKLQVCLQLGYLASKIYHSTSNSVIVWTRWCPFIII